MVLLYVPLPDQQTSTQIAKTLLEKKLIACANIFSPHTAIYEWEGKINEETEQITIFKTSLDKKDLAMAEIEKIHPYDCPCILAIEPTQGNSAFLQWVEQQTRP